VRPVCPVGLLGAALDRSRPLAVYLLSFWHYYSIGSPSLFGAVAFDVFKRDAVAMKTVSVAALATVYLAAPLDLASLIVVACGILLNVRAAAALGSTGPITVTRWPACRRGELPPFPIADRPSDDPGNRIAAWRHLDQRRFAAWWPLRACMSPSTSDCSSWSWPARGAPRRAARGGLASLASCSAR